MDPQRRLQAIGEARIAIDEPVPAEPPRVALASPARSRAVVPWIAAAALAIALIGTLLWRPSSQSVTNGPIRLSLDVGEQPPLTPAGDFSTILSPDGSRVAVAGKFDGKLQLATRKLDEVRFVPLAGTGGRGRSFLLAGRKLDRLLRGWQAQESSGGRRRGDDALRRARRPWWNVG